MRMYNKNLEKHKLPFENKKLVAESNHNRLIFCQALKFIVPLLLQTKLKYAEPRDIPSIEHHNNCGTRLV
jgi:hypothetical protein